MERELLTVQQVAEVTGLSVKTHYNLRSQGEGPDMFLLRRRLRCYADVLEAWIKQQSSHPHVTPLRRSA